MEDTMMRPAMPGEELCGCDRETFERVWRRVMREGNNDPIQADSSADEQVSNGMKHGQELQVVERTELALPRKEEGRPEQDIACLGGGSSGYAPLLREMMDGETENYRTYQALARRAGNNGTRMLGGMAADKRRNAKRLGAAYFLITGEQYRSPNMMGSRPPMDLMNGLREQFIQEQRGAAAYEGAAQETADPCLRQLFRELGQEAMGHARMIRSLLEQM